MQCVVEEEYTNVNYIPAAGRGCMQHSTIPPPYPVMQQPQYPGVQYQQFVPGFFPSGYVPYSQSPGGVQLYMDSRGTVPAGVYPSESATIMSSASPSLQDKGPRNEVSDRDFSPLLTPVTKFEFMVSFCSKKDFWNEVRKICMYVWFNNVDVISNFVRCIVIFLLKVLLKSVF